MLYIISGTSRSGKTIIANNIMEQKSIPYLSLDWLVMGFTNGIPEYGIHDKLFPDEIARRFWSFFKAMCESMIWSEIDYVIEGEAVLPHLIDELIKRHPDHMRICFVGYTDVRLDEKVKDIYKYANGKNDWLTNESKDFVEDHIKNMIAHSKMIKKECEMYELQYFDTSKSFVHVLDDAMNYLLK